MRRTRLPILVPALAVIIAVASAVAADAQQVRGRIVQIQPDQHRLTLKTRKGHELQLTVDDESRLRLNQHSARLSDFQEGMRVRVNFELKDGHKHVLSMSEPPITLGKIQNRISQTLGTIASYSYQQKGELEQKIRSVLNDVDDRMDELEERAETAAGQAKQEIDRQLEHLRQERDQLKDKLNRVKNATPAAWQDILSGVNSAIADIEQSIDRARERIK